MILEKMDDQHIDQKTQRFILVFGIVNSQIKFYSSFVLHFLN